MYAHREPFVLTFYEPHMPSSKKIVKYDEQIFRQMRLHESTE